MIGLFLLAAAQPAASEPAPSLEPDCSYDLGAMLELDRQAFDQDLPNGGWRGLYNRGCYADAAELIREWRHEKRDHADILYAHEGQMRAYAGQTNEAISLLRLTYKSMDEDANFGWNFYIDGTIAFLEKNRKEFQTAMERLKAIPKRDAPMAGPDGKLVKVRWPPNLNVMEGFEKCWDQPFRVEFSKACTGSFFED